VLQTLGLNRPGAEVSLEDWERYHHEIYASARNNASFLKEVTGMWMGKEQQQAGMLEEVKRRMAARSKGGRIEVAKELRAFDSDGDGSLDQPEFFKFLKLIGMSLNRFEEDLLFAYFDLDGRWAGERRGRGGGWGWGEGGRGGGGRGEGKGPGEGEGEGALLQVRTNK
jgi:hypothetical protein